MAKQIAGKKFPNFTVDTLNKKGVTIEELVGGKQTFLWFSRYIGCPTCRLDAQLLSERYNEFVEKGANIVMVMQSSEENVLKATDGKGFPFELILDPDQKLYKELEIGSTPEGFSFGDLSPEDSAKFAEKIRGMQKYGFKHGEYEGNEQQMPALFHLMGGMNTAEAHYAANPMDMPSIDEVLAKIKTGSRVEAGDKFPNMVLATNKRESVSIEELVGGQRTFFWFLRYIGCTICHWDAWTLKEKYQEFLDKGVKVYVVMQSRPEMVNAAIEGEDLPEEFICDFTEDLYTKLAIPVMKPGEGREMSEEAARRFAVKRAGVQSRGYKHGEYEGNEGQLPAFFDVDGDMTVREAHYATYITDIPTVEEMLEKI